MAPLKKMSSSILCWQTKKMEAKPTRCSFVPFRRPDLKNRFEQTLPPIEKAETLTFQRNEFLELLKNAIFLRLEFQKKFQVGQQTKIKSPHQCHQFVTYVENFLFSCLKNFFLIHFSE